MDKALELALSAIKLYEGCKLKAYVDTGGVWTIGYGNIHYDNGISVKQGDTITQEQAEAMLKEQIMGYYLTVKKMPVVLTNNKIAALTSFCYNVGVNNFKKSTLYKKVVVNPNDPTIQMEFLKWNKDNGKVVEGLVNRRKKEVETYYL